MKNDGLCKAIMLMVSKYLGRPAKVINLVDILEVSKQTAYNKVKSNYFTAADLDKVSQKTGISLFLVGVDAHIWHAEIETFPLFDVTDVTEKLRYI